MSLINLFSTQAEFRAFRDSLGAALAKDLSLPLKSRKLDELAAHALGAKDFNTAVAAINNRNRGPNELMLAVIDASDVTKAIGVHYMAELAVRVGHHIKNKPYMPYEDMEHADLVGERAKLVGASVYEGEWGWRWKSKLRKMEGSEAFPGPDEAWTDAALKLGVCGFCSPRQAGEVFLAEGWILDFFHDSQEGLQIQLMGSVEPELETTPELSDEEAWEFVVERAKKGSHFHQQALDWLEMTSPHERWKIKEHTGY